MALNLRDNALRFRATWRGLKIRMCYLIITRSDAPNPPKGEHRFTAELMYWNYFLGSKIVRWNEFQPIPAVIRNAVTGKQRNAPGRRCARLMKNQSLVWADDLPTLALKIGTMCALALQNADYLSPEFEREFEELIDHVGGGNRC